MVTPAVLARSRALVEPALVAAVSELADELLPAIRYHFGWADVDGTPADVDTGKRLRPALTVLSAEAFGASDAAPVPGGAVAPLRKLSAAESTQPRTGHTHEPSCSVAFGSKLAASTKGQPG